MRRLTLQSLTVMASAESIPVIIDGLIDSDTTVRQEAESDLILLGKRAVPALQAAAKDPNGAKRDASTEVLKKINPQFSIRPLSRSLSI